MHNANSLTRLLLVSLFVGAFDNSSHAIEVEKQIYRDIRFLGRGNTGVASVNDASALFYNPAGLASSTSYTIRLMNGTLGTNKHVVDSSKTGFSLKSDQKSLTTKFSPYLGKQLGAEYGVFPSLSIPYLAIGYFNVGSASMTYRNPVNPEFIVRARYDRGVIFGGGIPIGPHFSLGVAVKFFKRSQVYSDISGGDLLLASSAALDRYLNSGEAWGANVGSMYKLPVGSNSTLNFGTAVDDVGYTKIKNARSPRSQPPAQAMVWSQGVAYEYDTENLGFKALIDVRQLNTAGISYTKKIHMGAEISFLKMDIRGGFNQGYYTAGITSRLLKFVHLDAVTYGEELDSTAGLRENRIYLVGLTFGMELKPGKGKKQRLNIDNVP